jgi:hypothetical protein
MAINYNRLVLLLHALEGYDTLIILASDALRHAVPKEAIDLPWAKAKSAKSKAISMKVHPERADGDIKTKWEKNYGDEENNYAQDGTHCPQDRTEGGARCPQDRAESGAHYSQDRAESGAHYSQDRKEGGAHYSQHRKEGGARCSQDGAKAYIANCIADYTAGSPALRYIKRTGRNRC